VVLVTQPEDEQRKAPDDAEHGGDVTGAQNAQFHLMLTSSAVPWSRAPLAVDDCPLRNADDLPGGAPYRSL
jgi:hypothetical protein